jgi:hypothetical protein
MKIKTAICYYGLLSLTLISCSRKIDVQKVDPFVLNSTAVLLADKYWIETNVLVERAGSDTVKQDIILQFPSADRDDILFFSSDGTYRFDEGSTKHHELNKQVFQQGQWRLDEQEHKLHLVFGGAATTYELLEVSERELILKLAVSQRGQAYTYKLHFVPMEDKTKKL